MSDGLGEQLLAAQVAFTRRLLLTDDSYQRLVIDEVEGFLAEAAQLTLDDVVTREMIKNTAYKYAAQMPLEGSIPELVGEIAGRLHRHPINDEVRLDELVDARGFDDLVSAVADTAASHRFLDDILRHPATVDMGVEVIAHAVGAGQRRTRFTHSGDGTPIARAVAAAAGTAGALLYRVTRSGVRHVLTAAADESHTLLQEAAREIWRTRSGAPVGTVRDLVTAADVEDLVVVIFEFWKSFRDTEYFRTLLNEGVDHVFDKYGDVALVALLTDLGVGRADLIEEGMRFGPPILAQLDERGILNELLHRQFAPFYSSAEFHAAVAGLRS